MKVFIGVIIFFVAGCTSLPNAQKVETNQGTYTFYAAGFNKPTVVFDAGLGDDMTSWKSIITQVESTAEVFAYNRAGFSGSKSKNKQRNGQVIVEELRELLKSTKKLPPYVLVGHSLGCNVVEYTKTNVQLYAKKYPEEVSGVVLVDPYPSKYPARCKIEKLDYCKPPSSMPWWAALILPTAIEGEIIGFADTLSQVNAIDRFPNVPLVVLSATTFANPKNDKQKRHNKVDVQLKQELSESSANSKHIICDTCSHYIHEDDPLLVINAIKWVLNEATNK